MALYDVSRTDVDSIEPGAFVSAFVVAGGTAQARAAVEHLEGVTPKNLRARRVDLTSGIRLLSAYWDEREVSPQSD